MTSKHYIRTCVSKDDEGHHCTLIFNHDGPHRTTLLDRWTGQPTEIVEWA